MVNYSGQGRGTQGEAIRINGKSDWPYDADSEDHIRMEFRQIVKFGENTVWGWVVGSEILVGGTIGAGAAIASTTAATGPLGLGLATWIGSGGAVAGTAALVSISKTVKELTEESNEPVDPPDPPKRPTAPNGDESFTPKKGMIYIALSHDGRLRGSGPDGVLILTGTCRDEKGSGNVTIDAQ